MPAYICKTCGVQYAPSERPPERCPICEDERQYVGWQGQQWTTMEELIAEGRRNELREEEPGLTLLNPGGHFEGAAVLHWAGGAGGHGALLSGDTVTVVMDRRYVSFMYSYPNLIPLPEGAIRRILDTLRPYRFERVYGAWNG